MVTEIKKSNIKNIIIILGTRPEAIKLAPVILELKKLNKYKVTIVNTEQQKELSNQTLSFFGIRPDICLNCMKPNQCLATLQARILNALEQVYQNPMQDKGYHATIVQGDTMSAFCGALTSFYHKIPVFHVEAGLRSYNLFEPFPEEAFRQMIAKTASLHFTPTALATQSLQNEGIDYNNIIETGNTVLDALFCLSKESLQNARCFWSERGINLESNTLDKNCIQNISARKNPKSNIVLVTTHRRENHGQRLDRILQAIQILAKRFSNVVFIVPVHPNPNVKQKIEKSLMNLENVMLCEPLDYPNLVLIMYNSKLILTDSGGIQEEAPSFGVPILVLRYETERKEGLQAGFAKLVGAECERIVGEASLILEQNQTLITKPNPYGDGTASLKITKAIESFFNIYTPPNY
ncbi:non-hydrolyzing UDP-N-acetylglucosamine 2-epimerase [Helicobacter muridarum]|uniref:UDP-N-acetylglucosamine 2-epimerase (non-hydrolyzing) n=1 Tax=Helicobacter muridarum TaxID=216 RepID=A0A377PS74_9HELI|nr:UDP-N-acetylglucosamine 2-epimerase (non-hydrolyzing) [Helicobacter muridarum]STQ85457.1 UDP-N-acetylglucosamine 2-epimerase [Helicobacter muridarum]